MLTDAVIARLCSDLGRRIKATRSRRGLNPRQLGELVGLSRSSIVNLEAGRQRVPVHTIWRLSSALGVPVARLVPELDAEAGDESQAAEAVLRNGAHMNRISAHSQKKLRLFVTNAFAENSRQPASTLNAKTESHTSSSKSHRDTQASSERRSSR